MRKNNNLNQRNCETTGRIQTTGGIVKPKENFPEELLNHRSFITKPREEFGSPEDLLHPKFFPWFHNSTGDKFFLWFHNSSSCQILLVVSQFSRGLSSGALNSSRGFAIPPVVKFFPWFRTSGNPWFTIHLKNWSKFFSWFHHSFCISGSRLKLDF